MSNIDAEQTCEVLKTSQVLSEFGEEVLAAVEARTIKSDGFICAIDIALLLCQMWHDRNDTWVSPHDLCKLIGLDPKQIYMVDFDD